MSMVLYGLMLNEHFVKNLFKYLWFYEVSLNGLNMIERLKKEYDTILRSILDNHISVIQL